MTITIEKWPGFIPGHEGKKMKIEIIKSTYVNGKRYEKTGKAIEVDDVDGHFLVAIGKAVKANPPKKKVKSKEDDLDIKTK